MQLCTLRCTSLPCCDGCLCAAPPVPTPHHLQPFFVPPIVPVFPCSDANVKERPIMIHRAILGSLERFFGILVENYAGEEGVALAHSLACALTALP